MGSSKDFSIVTRILMDSAGFTTGKDKITTEGKAMEKAITSSSNAMKDSFGALTNTALPALAGQFGVLGTVVSGMKPIFANLVKAVASADAAIIATGVGAIIIGISLAIAGLISWMKRTDEGADKMREVFNGIKAVISVVLDKLALVGKALYELSQGHFEQAWNDLKSAMTGWGDAISANIAKSKELSAAQDALEKFDVTYLLKKSAIESDIAEKQLEAHKKLESTGKFDQKANEDLKVLKTQLYYLEVDRMNIQIKQAEAERDSGKNTYETRQKVNDLYAQRNGLYTTFQQSLRENEKLDNKNMLTDVQRLALADKMLKRQEEINALKDKAITYGLTGYAQEQKAIKDKYDLDILKAKDDVELKDAITKDYLAHLLSITKKNEEDIQKIKNETILASMDGQIKEQTAIDQKYAEEYAAAEGNAAMQTALDDKHIADSLAAQKEADKKEAEEAKKTNEKIEADKSKQSKLAATLQLKLQTEGVRVLSNAFDQLFQNGKNGWQSLLDSMVKFFEKMIAEVLAAIVVWGILDLLTGFTAKGIGTLGGFIKSTLGFGGKASGGTLPNNAGYSLVGENGVELMQNAGQKIYNNSETKNILGGNGGGKVTFELAGTMLRGVLINVDKQEAGFA